MEENKVLKWLPMITGIIFLAMPVITWVLTLINLKCVDTGSAWIGFFGSYFGSIVSGVITLYVLYVTMQQTRNIQTENTRITKEIQAENSRITRQIQDENRKADQYRERIAREPILVVVAEGSLKFKYYKTNCIQTLCLSKIVNNGFGYAKNINIAWIDEEGIKITTNANKDILFVDSVVWRPDEMIWIGRFRKITDIVITYQDAYEYDYETRYKIGPDSEPKDNGYGEEKHYFKFDDMKFIRK